MAECVGIFSVHEIEWCTVHGQMAKDCEIAVLIEKLAAAKAQSRGLAEALEKLESQIKDEGKAYIFYGSGNHKIIHDALRSYREGGKIE